MLYLHRLLIQYTSSVSIIYLFTFPVVISPITSHCNRSGNALFRFVSGDDAMKRTEGKGVHMFHGPSNRYQSAQGYHIVFHIFNPIIQPVLILLYVFFCR